MANHRVLGQLVPDAVSGHVALEIANTRAGWGSATPRGSSSPARETTSRGQTGCRR